MNFNGQLLDKYFDKFKQINKKPGLLVFLIWLARGLIKPKWRDQKMIERYFYVNTCKVQEHLSRCQLPEIEILFASKQEDFVILLESVSAAINMSINPVRKVSVIVPENDLNLCKQYFRNCVYLDKIAFIPETNVVSGKTIELIKNQRPDRFGWILQQVIVAEFILRSDCSNILIVDADTILLRKKVWVDVNQNQILMPTQEIHLPYYNFLSNVSEMYSIPKFSFVSHHLLVQTEVFRGIYNMFFGDINCALQKAFDLTKLNEPSPFDLKYEIYSQYLYKNFPERVDLIKWGNLTCPRREFDNFISSEKGRKILSMRYNSVSFHHWNI